MEFVAVTKTGVHVYDPLASKKEEGFDSVQDASDTVVSLPPVTNTEGKVSATAEGAAWSPNGTMLATVDSGVAVLWDADDSYERLMELPPIGTSGGVRAMRFSPKGTFLITYEKHDKEKCPENMQVWEVRRGRKAKRLRLHTLKGYSSGVVPIELIQWSQDESVCLELVPGEGIVVLEGKTLEPEEPRRLIREPQAALFQIAPKAQGDSTYVACYVPESPGRPGEVLVYYLDDLSEPTARVSLPAKLKSCLLLWNSEGSALLALASSDVDETGASYFGTSSLFWLMADGSKTEKISGAEEGLVQDVAWSPTKNEFLLIVGMLPAVISLYDGKNGKLVSGLGKSRRNTIRWDPFGRLLVVGGFGALPGDVDFFDKEKGETVCSFRAALTVNCCWAPDGRHFLCCTTAPRMNEDNQASVFRYTGERIMKLEFRPDLSPGAGGRKAADAAAMLFASSWRPGVNGKFADRDLTPPKAGAKRVKGLPSEGASKLDSIGSTQAYRPGGGRGGGSVAAMMRGEMDAPASESRFSDLGGGGGRGSGGYRDRDDRRDDRGGGKGGGGERWGETTSGGMTHEELQQKLKERKEAEKKAKLEAEEAARVAKEQEKAAIKQIEDNEKLLRKLKKELARLDELKEKEWDELTEEDEAQLEGEVELRNRIAELEGPKKK